MKKAVALLAVVLSLGMTAVSFDADAAKRLGGGKSSGMQRQNTTAPANQPPAGNTASPASPSQAAPATAGAAAGAAAAAPRRSWMGPLAGLAAGIGLMALASHFGFGEGLANMMMIALLVMVVLGVVGYFMRKRAAGQGPAMAGAGANGGNPFQRQPQEPMFRTDASKPAPVGSGGSLIGSRVGGGMGAVGETAQASGIPAGFDTAGFASNAKSQFLALQAANDARDLVRLRDFLTPEMYDFVQADITERGDAPQQTEVFGLQAQVLSVVEEETRYVASVLFTGSVRDQQGAVPEDLDEVWHLTKPRAGQGGWLIAGIQQRSDTPAA